MILVKKYSNRRLYDTTQSSYITLEDLAEKIRSGSEVRVVDAKTGTDLTQATLAQIIIEGRGAGRLLPVPLLVQLIRMGDDALAEFFGQYMSMALELYLQFRRGAQRTGPFYPLVNTPFAAANAMARMFMAQSPWGSQPGYGPAGPWPQQGPPPSYPPNQPGYPPNQPGYPPNQPGYPAPQSGWPQQAPPPPPETPETPNAAEPPPEPAPSAAADELAQLRREFEALKESMNAPGES